MTTTETNPSIIFADARRMHSSALQRLDAGDIRDAAEKAWCATLRATEALVLARTDQAPHTSTSAGRRLQVMAQSAPPLRALETRYYHRQAILHGECFYHEYYQLPVIERLIHETADFIQDAEALSQN